MNPMDLGTMRRKVFNSEYTSIDAFKVGCVTYFFKILSIFTNELLLLTFYRTTLLLFVIIVRRTILPKLFIIKAPRNWGLLEKKL